MKCADDLNAAGWPRPFLATTRGAGIDRLPLPWANALNPVLRPDDGWMALEPERMKRCERERLCFCCGEEMGAVAVMGRYFGMSTTELDGAPIRLTDGPPGHPRCVALAVGFCPHLRRAGERTPMPADGIVAYATTARPPLLRMPEREPGKLLPAVVHPRAIDLDADALRAMAARDPLGLGA